MPTRDQFSSAVVTEKWTGQPDYVVTTKALGQKQSISALNNTGMFVPGILRMNPVTIEKWIQVGTPASNVPTNLKYGANNLSVSGDIASWLLMSTSLWAVNSANYASWDSTMASYSLAKAYAKLSEPDFDVGMILVELDETLNGLIRPLSALRKFINDFNKLVKLKRFPNIKEWRKNERSFRESGTATLDMLSGSWLEWRYGITPLIITIESAIKHFQDKSLLLEGKLYRKGGKVVKPVYYPPINCSAYPGYCGFTGTAAVTVEKKTVSSIYWQLTNPLTWQERYGLNAANIPSLVWERIPLSFVGDWFLGVGNWLQSINLSDKRSVIGSTTSQKTTVTWRLPDVNVYFGSNSYQCGSSAVLTYDRLERRVNQAPPLLPVVNPAALSLQRRLDAVTLIWQRLPKFRR